MKCFTALVLAALFAPAAHAQQQTFVANPDASQVKITLKTTHEVVYGTFRIQSGSLVVDRGSSKLSGSVVVLAASGKTGNGSRDKKMNKDVLEVEQYAAVSFEPKIYTGTIAPSGDSTIEVSGIFSLLGTPHPITLPILLHLEGSKATAKAHFEIPYIQWGLKDPSFLFWKADKEVAIDVLLNGQFL